MTFNLGKVLKLRLGDREQLGHPWLSQSELHPITLQNLKNCEKMMKRSIKMENYVIWIQMPLIELLFLIMEGVWCSAVQEEEAPLMGPTKEPFITLLSLNILVILVIWFDLNFREILLIWCNQRF